MQQRASQRKKKQRPKKILDAAQKDDSAEDYSSGSEEAYSNDEDEGKSGYKKGGYHPVTLGDTFKSGRYKVIRKLGWGHFSTVWLVSDSKTNTNAALKIVKSVSHYAAAARDEIQLLKVATERDPSGEKFCVRLIDHFEHRGPHGTHVCMVLEALGCNLLDLLKMFNNRGLPIPMVKCIAKQILTGLDFLHRQCAIIHTDLKPENVLLLATPVILGDDAPPAKPAVPPPGAPLPPPDDKSAAAQAKASAKNAKKRQKAKAKRLATKTAEGALPPAVIQTSSSDGHSLSGSNKSISFHYSSPAAPPPPHPALQPSQSAVSISAEHNAPEHPRLKNKPESAGVPLPASLPVTPQVTPQLQRQAAATRLDASITKLEAYVASETPDPAQAPASAAPATAPAVVPEPAKSDAPAAADASAAPPAAAPAAGATAAELGCPPLEPGMRRLAYDPKRNASRIADFGNACWVHKHFTDNVQTREYRSPEVIIGAKYNTTCDLWSMACMTFELLTGDLLFEPKESDAFTKNDDHLAQMVELLGRIPKAFALSGRNSKDFFTRNGDLRNISELNFWPLEKVLEEKYKYDAKDAAEIASFLGQMLKFNPLQRASAQECLRHSWLADAEKVAGNFYDLPRRRTKSAKPATPEESTGEGSDEEDASESDEEEGEVKSTIVP